MEVGEPEGEGQQADPSVYSLQGNLPENPFDILVEDPLLLGSLGCLTASSITPREGEMDERATKILTAHL
ncbi:hypothetical protein SDC9_84938 [bioreactor metagenome]|uniref:Uncharacterized protein n=1 Tax=bioreactor metagenome TaxID=1076179 RepID=A0A644ZC46_9ZZZZ